MRGGVCVAGPSILLAGDKTRRSGRRVTERAPRGNRESLMRERESHRAREEERERERERLIIIIIIKDAFTD